MWRSCDRNVIFHRQHHAKFRPLAVGIHKFYISLMCTRDLARDAQPKPVSCGYAAIDGTAIETIKDSFAVCSNNSVACVANAEDCGALPNESGHNHTSTCSIVFDCIINQVHQRAAE